MKIRLLATAAAIVVGSAGAVQAGALYTHDVVSAQQDARFVQLVSEDAVEGKAEAFVSNLTNQGIGFLSDKAASPAQQKESFRKLLNSNFDMNTIARFSLGANWKQASKEQRSEYLDLFNKMIVDVYSQRF